MKNRIYVASAGALIVGAGLMYMIAPSGRALMDDGVEIAVDKDFESVFNPTAIRTLALKESTLDALIDESKLLEAESSRIQSNQIQKIAGTTCWDQRPKTIEELTDGVLIDAYSFEKGDEKKIGLLGFFNVELLDNQRVIVVEYSQEGTQICEDKEYKFGVGARLMMKVTKSKRNAKLTTPQQITASVIFGRAEVTYSLKTFGITGPGIARLSRTGSLSEDTYQRFLQEISNLIVEMYKEDSKFIVDPKPLPLKNIVP